MLIDIVGYVTKTNGANGFTIKVTSDKIDYPPGNDIQVSKEVEVHIDQYRYPVDNDNVFERVSGRDDYRSSLIDTHRSLSNALRPGDRLKCSVFIVEREMRNGVEVYVINTNRKDIQSYADFPLWLCPYDNRFERLEFDTPDTIKFRKQNYYTNINQKKCEKITGSEWYKYRDKPWINKHPIRTFPRIWGIQVKTTVSNLWKILMERDRLMAILLFTSILVNIMQFIWGFFRKP